jgi:hypothetical protein
MEGGISGYDFLRVDPEEISRPWGKITSEKLTEAHSPTRFLFVGSESGQKKSVKLL